MKLFIKKNKLNIAVLIFLVIVTSLFYFLIVPLVGKIAAKANDIQQKKIDKELNEKKLASISTMEEDFSKFKDNEDKFFIMIEPTKELDFIKELESLADQTGNKIEFKIAETTNVKPVAKAKNAEVDIKSKLGYTNFLSMQIALEGGYASLLDFINKLENYKKYVNVMSISSEKRITATVIDSSNPFAVADQVQNKETGKETINSVLDVVIYIKK